MFTGLVEGMGSVVRVTRRGGGARLEVRAPQVARDLAIGDSISVNGACVTVTERNEELFACDLVPETVARTNLGILQVGEEVNFERPVRAVDRLGGHIVQGHVDAVGIIRSRRRVGAQEMLEITVPFELTRYIAPQGSVCLDGVSLTIVSVDRDRFRVAIIPHTVSVTTLGLKGQGASVNVEVDILAKYVERQMAARAARPAFAFVEDAPRREEPILKREVVAVPKKKTAAAKKPVAAAPKASAAAKGSAAKSVSASQKKRAGSVPAKRGR